ncbi:hypothetical protein [Gracilimonas sp.]|uniref:hypothetical protein n=1 Tax=Gracilimonas sp. TaxID=1974203 RepID=UPI0032EC910E
MKKLLFVYTIYCLFFYSISYGQVQVEKESLHISYDECEERDKIKDKGSIRFILCSESFLYKAENHSKAILPYNQIKDSLITVHEAKKKVKEYLEKVAKEFEKQAKNDFDKEITSYIKNPGTHYYNSYFNKVYVYVRENQEVGTLYEVSWEFYIE